MWLLSPKERIRRFVRWLVDQELSNFRNEIEQLSSARDQLEQQFRVEQLEKLSTLRDRIEQLEELLTAHSANYDLDLNAPTFPSPVVSVILPTWNRAGLVGVAIRSVQAQRFQDWELIVVDDGSEDATAESVASFSSDKRIQYVKLPHAGQCIARNHGLAVSQGSLIAYIDSDNLWYPGYLEAAVPVFKSHPHIDLGYGALISDTHGRKILWEQFDRDRLLSGNYIDTSTIIHRRKLFEQLGGFDQNASPLEDWDLVLRYTAHADAFRIPVVAARYRSVDTKRVSDNEDNVSPTERVRGKWQT